MSFAISFRGLNPVPQFNNLSKIAPHFKTPSLFTTLLASTARHHSFHTQSAPKKNPLTWTSSTSGTTQISLPLNGKTMPVRYYTKKPSNNAEIVEKILQKMECIKETKLCSDCIETFERFESLIEINFLLMDVKNINVKDAKGNTLLHIAALMNDIQLCDMIIKYGGDKSAKNDQGLKPVDLLLLNNWGLLPDPKLEALLR